MFAPYKQFNVFYHDFTYNDKRVKCFTRFEDAFEFANGLIGDRTYRLIEIKPVYSRNKMRA